MNDCLLNKLKTAETEQPPKFDYTIWQREHFDSINAEDFNNAAVAYAKTNPFRTNS